MVDRLKARVFGGLCFALVALIVSTGWLYVRWRWMSSHPQAQGVVLEHVPQSKGMVAEAIQYKAEDGRENRMLGELTRTPIPVGTTVTVRYDPENPRDGVVEMQGKTYAPILWAMLTSGVAALVLGGVWWRLADDE